MTTSQTSNSSRGPSAHEDLTIAEHLKQMLATNEHRPNERGYLDENGKMTWVSADRVDEFLREFGALHPSDYESRQGQPWQTGFFEPAQTS